MIYLDYSATTPPDARVLDAYITTNKAMYGNPNSTHELGVFAKRMIQETTHKIQDILDCPMMDVVYTSGATEANNLALKGYAFAILHRGNHIITSPYEHSSVTSCLNYLAKHGFIIDVVETTDDGLIDLEDLASLITKDTILVSIAMINSELGLLQDMAAISKCLAAYDTIAFHSDMTQAIGKLNVDLTGCDMVTFSAHKFYGLKGIGALLKKKHLLLEPVIHGGKSTTIFRGGTPPAPLIDSLGHALSYAYESFEDKFNQIKSLYRYVIDTLVPSIKGTHLNYENGIPQIINLSFPTIEAHKLQAALNERKIYISTQTACNSEASFSHTVKRVTGSDLFAKTSVRISLSHHTTKTDLDTLFQAIKEIIDENH